MRLGFLRAKGEVKSLSRIDPEALRVNFRRKFTRYTGARDNYIADYREYPHFSISLA
jgi:hypothetical protein